MIEIAPEKVAHVIIRARAFDSKVGAWDDADTSDASEDSDSVLEDMGGDATRDELAAFIDGLNVDEQVSLVAVTWVGRGTFEAEDIKEAIDMARNERVNATSAYLLGIPMLSDYLEEGLEKLGFSIEDAEGDVM